MPNLNPPAQFDKSSPEARAEVRRFMAECAWSLSIVAGILQDYALLEQDAMVLFSARQIRAYTKALIAAGRQLHELSHG